MSTLIPAIGACVERMTGGERLMVRRLEDELDDHYLRTVGDKFDGMRLVTRIGCGREWQAPFIIKQPSLREEAAAIADQQRQLHKEGRAWGAMTIVCADWKTMGLCADPLHQGKLPFNVPERTGEYNPMVDSIQIMTMKVSKGLEFSMMALPCVRRMSGSSKRVHGCLCGGCASYSEVGGRVGYG